MLLSQTVVPTSWDNLLCRNRQLVQPLKSITVSFVHSFGASPSGILGTAQLVPVMLRESKSGGLKL